MNKNITGFTVFAAIILSMIEEHTVGFSIQIINDDISVAGGTSILAIISSLIMIVLTYLHYDIDSPISTNMVPTVSKRISSTIIDGIFTMVGIAGLVGLIPTFIEYSQTGVFSFSFERDHLRSTDTVTMLLSGVCSLFIAGIYFGYPLRTKKQTIGNYLTGIIVLPTTSDNVGWGKGLARLLLTFIAVAGFFITILIGRDKDGRYWHDKATDTNVFLTE